MSCKLCGKIGIELWAYYVYDNKYKLCQKCIDQGDAETRLEKKEKDEK